MVLTGRPIVEGNKVQPDRKEMACADAVEWEYKYEMPHRTVDLDEMAQKEFSRFVEVGRAVSCKKT